MNIKKILKRLKFIYDGLKLWLEFTFRIFVIMILIEFGLALNIIENLNVWARFAVVMSLLYFAIKPLLIAIENKFFWRYYDEN